MSVSPCEWRRSCRSHLVNGDDHVGLELEQPLLHLPARLRRADDVTQLDDLALRAAHVRDVQNVGERQLGDALEALLQVRLYSAGGTRKVKGQCDTQGQRSMFTADVSVIK